MKRIVKYLATTLMLAIIIFSCANHTEKIVDNIPFIMLIIESIVGITILWFAWNERD